MASCDAMPGNESWVLVGGGLWSCEGTIGIHSGTPAIPSADSWGDVSSQEFRVGVRGNAPIRLARSEELTSLESADGVAAHNR